MRDVIRSVHDHRLASHQVRPVFRADHPVFRGIITCPGADGAERSARDTVVFLGRFNRSKNPAPSHLSNCPPFSPKISIGLMTRLANPTIATSLREATHPSRVRLGRAPPSSSIKKHSCFRPFAHSRASSQPIPLARGEYRTKLL